MAIWQGTYYQVVFILTDCATGAPIPTNAGWQLRSQFREDVDDAVLLELTTANGGFSVLPDYASGMISMQMTAVQTVTLPEGNVVFDVMRTDGTYSPVLLFSGKVPVKQPVTRA